MALAAAQKITDNRRRRGLSRELAMKFMRMFVFAYVLAVPIN